MSYILNTLHNNKQTSPMYHVVNNNGSHDPKINYYSYLSEQVLQLLY